MTKISVGNNRTREQFHSQKIVAPKARLKNFINLIFDKLPVMGHAFHFKHVNETISVKNLRGHVCDITKNQA